MGEKNEKYQKQKQKKKTHKTNQPKIKYFQSRFKLLDMAWKFVSITCPRPDIYLNDFR